MSSTIAPTASARWRAAASRSAPGAEPATRAYSPSWGVRMLGALRLSSSVRAVAASPRAVSASASITRGTGAPATTARISSATASPVPRPGPITIALHFAVASKNAPDQPSAGRCIRTASVGQAADGSPGDPSRIMPEPAAMAPREHRMAEPSMPAEPAATPTAFVHLFDPAGRAGTSAPTSASSTSATRGVGNRIPMSATSTVPLAPARRPGAARASAPRTSRCVPPTRRTGRSTGVGVHARGDVDGEDGRAWRHHGRVEACPGSRCRRRRRSPGRTPASRPGGRFGVDHLHPGPAPGQHPGGHPSVRAVVALARHHHDPAAVGPPNIRRAATATAVPARWTRVS